MAPAGYLDLKDGEEPTLQVSLQRQVGISVQEVLVWKDTTSSRGVLRSLPSGTIPRSNLDPLTPEAVVPPSPSDESILTRKFKRSRSVKSTRGERVENGAMKTWEWKGAVCNVGIEVGGCSTEVLVIKVSIFLSFSPARGGVTHERLVIGLLCV